MTRILLTERALSDLDAIEAYSRREWGKRIADRYLADIEASLQRLGSKSSILHDKEGAPDALRFLNVREHVLICVLDRKDIVVLTIWHSAMDFLDRLNELEPQLMEEAEILRDQLERTKRKRR